MRRLAISLAGLLTATAAAATPDFRAARDVGGLTVYPDDRRSTLFYYGPGDLSVAHDADGRPDLHLLETRYIGTAADGDRGRTVFRSLLSVRVAQVGRDPLELEAARRVLGANAELRPVPIQKLEAAFVYAPLDDTGAPAASGEDATPLPAGHFESVDAEAAASYWSERTYVLSLGADDAQLFWDALQHGRVALSFGYAFFAVGATASSTTLEISGPATLGDELRQRIAEALKSGGPPPPDSVSRPAATLLRAGATAITLDADRWPDLLRRIDLNESLPPGYAALDVYCYDFNNALRPDLYEKRVDVEAEGVTGAKISLPTSFQAAHPDLYARSLRFPVAVRLDRPYRFRVTEIGFDGAARSGPWTAAGSWNHVLDVTSAPPTPASAPTAEEP